MLSLVPNHKVLTLYLDTGTKPEFWVGYLKKGVFTLVLSVESYAGTVPGHQLWTLPKSTNHDVQQTWSFDPVQVNCCFLRGPLVIDSSEKCNYWLGKSSHEVPHYWQPWGGGCFLVMGHCRCATGWGRIFTTGLTIVGSPFQAFSIEFLDWVAIIQDFESQKIICPKMN